MHLIFLGIKFHLHSCVHIHTYIHSYILTFITCIPMYIYKFELICLYIVNKSKI